MERITGKIVNYHRGGSKRPGIQMDNRIWYNSGNYNIEMVEALNDKVDHEVELEISGKTIKSVKFLSNNQVATPKVSGTTIGMAIKEANMKVLRDLDKNDCGEISSEDWAKRVIENTTALLIEMNRIGDSL